MLTNFKLFCQFRFRNGVQDGVSTKNVVCASRRAVDDLPFITDRKFFLFKAFFVSSTVAFFIDSLENSQPYLEFADGSSGNIIS